MLNWSINGLQRKQPLRKNPPNFTDLIYGCQRRCQFYPLLSQTISARMRYEHTFHLIELALHDDNRPYCATSFQF